MDLDKSIAPDPSFSPWTLYTDWARLAAITHFLDNIWLETSIIIEYFKF
jgi:hypothetical protein